MPLVRMTVSVGCDDLPSRPGTEVQLSPERAQQVVMAGWGEYVRSAGVELPERRVPRPERAVERPTGPAPTPTTPETTEGPENASEPVEEAPKPRRRTTRKTKS